jgi:hypothetical protein
MVRTGTTYMALVPTVIGVGEQESRQDGRSSVRKGPNYTALVPTVSRQDGRSGEASQVDSSKRNYLYSTGSYRNWHR